MASGTIARLTDKNFGFIRVDGGWRDQDLFFHASALLNISFDALTVGQPVTFTPSRGPKGERAESVHVTSA